MRQINDLENNLFDTIHENNYFNTIQEINHIREENDIINIIRIDDIIHNNIIQENIINIVHRMNDFEFIPNHEMLFDHFEREHDPHAQNTHTASVHRSVSASALRLEESYALSFDLENTIANINIYINSLESSLKNDAAKRCFNRITNIDFTYEDPVSHLSIRQVLALVYEAIHDDTKRIGSLEDAKTLFIEGLYEIQRGYNLNAEGIDNQAADSSICLGGTFNKLMEKLNGIHTDVEICFVTQENAFLKFPKVAQKHALTYLTALASPENFIDYQKIKALLDTLKKDGIDSIWDQIKEQVSLEIWEEFKEAFGSNPEHPSFTAMIDNGNFIELPDITKIENLLTQSAGYQDLLRQLERTSIEEGHILLNLHKHSLWTNRYASPETQHAFDSRYGLTIAMQLNR